MSTTLKDRLALPVPQRMRTLARDPRGYPVPFLVMVDKAGIPQFTINDDAKVNSCFWKRLCAICGKRMEHGAYWFVGGSRCFLHERGAFLDPPAHLECAEYALAVCPFLAARSYGKRIDDRKLTAGAMPDDRLLVRQDFMQPALPERFGLGMAAGYQRIHDHKPWVYVVDDWRYVEWWREGQRINAPDSGEPPPDEEWVRS